MIRINEVKFGLGEALTDELILKKLSTKTGFKSSDILSYEIVKESIDARKDIVFSYTIDIVSKNDQKLIAKGYKLAPEPYQLEFQEREYQDKTSPVIIGAGPAGLFSGLVLAHAGLKPIVLELGEDVDQRSKTVDKFWKEGVLDIHSNVQFGEGGAGTFSDGKLTTRVKDQRIEYVIDTFIKAGAPSEIKYKNKPHIGTDILKNVVKNIRTEIQRLGGTVRFTSEVESILLNESREVIGVQLKNSKEVINCLDVVLATGHSSRTMFEHLNNISVEMECKPFAVGVRIEHPQIIINASQHGKQYNHEQLGAADYKLTHQTQNGRSVYSFCMCPGGSVVASASEHNRLVVNGMSEFSRDLPNANSALLVNINVEDYQSVENTKDILSGIKWQRTLESKAFELGGHTYCAPTMTVGEFLSSTNHYTDQQNSNRDYYARFGVDYDAAFDQLKATYRPKTVNSDFQMLFPDFMIDALRESLDAFGNKIKGFNDPRAIMTAVESRSSSPIRVLRNSEQLMSTNTFGLYPCGEGAGYAGGITSSCVDGIKVAEAIINRIFKIDL